MPPPTSEIDPSIFDIAVTESEDDDFYVPDDYPPDQWTEDDPYEDGPSPIDAIEPIDVYTDGSCIDRKGPGGWAWIVPNGHWQIGCEMPSSNNRMELRAVLEVLMSLEGHLRIVSDSKYVLDAFVQRLYDKWIANEWMGKNNRPIANQDLWMEAIQVYESRSQEISFEWVASHSGNVWNNKADKLALTAATEQVNMAGDNITSAEKVLKLRQRVDKQDPLGVLEDRI